MTQLQSILVNMQENGGATLKNFKPISRKSGWQVATEGIVTDDIDEAEAAVNMYNGNCGLWKYQGKWYIDKSQRVATKKLAMDIGRKCKQMTVLRWKDLKRIDVK